jgi:hypothetical protein
MERALPTIGRNDLHDGIDGSLGARTRRRRLDLHKPVGTTATRPH